MRHDDGACPSPSRSPVDRRAEDRATPGLLQATRADATTRVLVIHGDRAPLATASTLHLVSPADAPADAEWAFLGRDAHGAAVVAAVVAPEAAEPFGAASGWASLRTVAADLDPVHAALFLEALSLGRWLLDAPFCPACGARTELRNAGWSRLCRQCGREHFPRTDPAIIVAVTSATDPDRLLLGSNALWGVERYSCFAGFVEAGESLESAVHRELAEEAGVRLSDIRYRGSQAWPYHRSLMLGFEATALDDGEARPDGEEIVAVRWFDREEIGVALAAGGEVLLPGRSSIAYRLISEWYARTP